MAATDVSSTQLASTWGNIQDKTWRRQTIKWQTSVPGVKCARCQVLPSLHVYWPSELLYSPCVFVTMVMATNVCSTFYLVVITSLPMSLLSLALAIGCYCHSLVPMPSHCLLITEIQYDERPLPLLSPLVDINWCHPTTIDHLSPLFLLW